MISKKLDYDVCIVSCDNQDEVPKKTTFGWVRGGFSCVHKQLYVKSPGFYHFSARFRTNFFMALSLLEVFRPVFHFIQILKSCFWKSISSLLSFRKAKHEKCIFVVFFSWMRFSSFLFIFNFILFYFIFLRHFNFPFWSRNFILRHFNLAVELKKYF